jgi:cell division protein FtsW
MFLIGMVMLFASGSRLIWMGAAGGVFSVAVGILIFFTDYAATRIDSWLHPENYSAQGEIWQTLQGMYAIGSGGLFGVGLGNSMQKHMFVSEPQNDFIFAIIGEELGLIGCAAVIALYIAFIWRGYKIATRTPDTFSGLVVIGIISKVGLQAMLNIAVVTGTIPNTGIALPFFSYGGSFLTILLAEMGLLLSISRYSYQQK